MFEFSTYFTNPEITTASKVLECVYIVAGLVSLYAGYKNFKDKENPSRIGTGLFWTALGIAIACARWLPSIIEGSLVVLMCLLSIGRLVKPGKMDTPTQETIDKNYSKIGMKLFLPALSMGILALIFGIFSPFGLSAYVGTFIGVIFSVIILMVWNKENKPVTFLKDSERFLSIVGPLSLLPTLLSILGAIFTQAQVGQLIGSLVGNLIPAGNIPVAIIVYAISMMIFTMIMGNAFAAITVITVGIAGPFILPYVNNVTLVGMLALTCGYCGTLCTPMAANFNIVPVAILEMKDRWGVIKQQVVPALIMVTVQIIYMILFCQTTWF